MSRACGDCTLCCKLEYIPELDKPTNTWCGHCKAGCSIYPERPKTCREFRCMWLDDPSMPEAMRPDRAGLYGVDCGEYIKVVAHVYTNWVTSRALNYIISTGKHILVMSGHQLNFICGEGKAMPKMLKIDWTL